MSLLTPASKIFLCWVVQVIARETPPDMAREPLCTSKLKHLYCAPALSDGDGPLGRGHTHQSSNPLLKNRTGKSTWFPLKMQPCLDTSLSLPLYFACTQLRDNSAVHQDGVRAEHLYRHLVQLFLQAEICNYLYKIINSGGPNTDWKSHLDESVFNSCHRPGGKPGYAQE